MQSGDSLGKKIYRFFTSCPDILNNIRVAYKNTSYIERIIFIVFIICYILSSVLITYNQLSLHYTDMMVGLLLPPSGALGYVILFVYCKNIQSKHPRTSLFLLGFLYMVLFAYTMFLTCGAAMLTPSTHLLNEQLKNWDLALGFDQLPYIRWTARYHWFHQTMVYAYSSWPFQIAFACPLLALCKRRTELLQWTLAGMVGIVIVSIIYYFYPSLPPASVYPQLHLDDGCYQCIDRFYLLHAYQPFAFTQCGLVVFPSCHVLYALLTSYAFRNVKWIFWPLLVLNVALIAATLLLGMHFLVDGLLSAALFVACSYFAYYFSTCNQLDCEK